MLLTKSMARCVQISTKELTERYTSSLQYVAKYLIILLNLCLVVLLCIGKHVLICSDSSVPGNIFNPFAMYDPIFWFHNMLVIWISRAKGLIFWRSFKISQSFLCSLFQQPNLDSVSKFWSNFSELCVLLNCCRLLQLPNRICFSC